MHPKYRPDIDGLRAVAVGSVLAYHAFPDALPGGFIGVDIFFVISGFLITTIILQGHADGSFSYRDFYARRVRRIFPALMLMLAAALAAGWYVLLPREFSELGKQAAGGMAFVANFIFWNESGYFDTVAETKPLLHLWSLGIEEQFYIFWPLLLALAWRRRWPILRWLWALAVVSFLVNVLMVHPYREAAFYSPGSRFWELMVGGILACLRSRQGETPSPSRWRSHAQSVLGVALIVYGLAEIRAYKAFPGWWALLPTLGAACCIAAGPRGLLNRYLLSNRAMVWIGLISYPLYLWHWPLLAYARIVEGGPPSAGMRALAVAASLALAWATYRFVERNVRQRSGSGMTRRLAGGAAAVMLIGLLALAGVSPRNGGDVLSKISDASVDDGYYDNVPRVKLGSYFVNRIGDGAGKVLLIGDSHVQQYGPRAAELSQTSRARMQTVYFSTYGACPPIPGLVADGNPDCARQRERMIELARDPQMGIVVVGACWNCYFTGNFPLAFEFRDATGSYPVNGGGPGIERSLNALQALLADLVARKKKVYLLLDNPSGPAFEPLRMIHGSRLGTLTAARDAPTTPLPEAQAQLNERLRGIAAASGAEALDVIASLCEAGGECLRSMPDGNPIYKDKEHLRPYYVRRNATYVDRLFLLPDGPGP